MARKSQVSNEGIAALLKEFKGASLGSQLKEEFAPSGLGEEFDKEVLGGGYEKGSFIIYWGPSGSGKSTAAYRAIAEHQRANPELVAVLVDTEMRFHKNRAVTQGVDLERLVVIRENVQETWMFTIEKIINEVPNVGVIVIDSLSGGLEEGKVKDKDYKGYGKSASNNADFLKKLSKPMREKGVTVFLLAQRRMKLGVVYGDPYDFPGGEAVRHYAAFIARFAAQMKLSKKDSKGNLLSLVIQLQISKNDYGRMCKTEEGSHPEVFFVSEDEVEKLTLYDDAVRAGVIVPSGPSQQLFDPLSDSEEPLRKWHGKGKIIEAINTDPELRKQLRGFINASSGNAMERAVDRQTAGVSDEEEADPADS